MRAIVTVVGLDRVGIIADVCTLLSSQNVNVLDISQTILNQNFTMVMVVDAGQAKVPFAELVTLLSDAGTQRGLTIMAQREDIFNAMHRI